MKETTTEQQSSQYLTFSIGIEELGIKLLHVREIVAYQPPTVVPLTPDYICGVINLRGNVVPIVDLARKFHLQQMKVTPRTCIVVVEVETHGETIPMGIITDSVSNVLNLSKDDVVQPPSFGTDIRLEYLSGMGKVEEKFVLLLDINKVLSVPELQTVARVQGGQGGSHSSTVV